MLSDFQNRFVDFKPYEDNFSLFTAHYSTVVQRIKSNIQMELAVSQCSAKLKYKYNDFGIPQFYYYLSSQCSEMHQIAVRILAVFGSTYLCV